MPYEGRIYQIQFGRQGMVSHPNRLLAQSDQLLLAENVAFDRDSAHRPVTLEYYDPFGLDREVATGTWAGGAVTWSGMLVGYPCSTSAAFVADVTAISALAQASPWTFAVGGMAAAGECCILSIVFLHGIITVSSVTDSKGNIWTRNAWVPAGGREQWASVLTTPLAPADTITVTSTGAGMPSDVVAVIESYSGVLSSTAIGWGGGTVSNPAVSIGAFYLRSYPALLVATVSAGADIATRTLTFSGGFTLREDQEIAGTLQVNQGSKVTLFGPQIITQIDWQASEEIVPGITVITSAGSNAVNATAGPSFLTSFHPGDEIIIGGETRIVSEIQTAAILLTTENWSAALGPVACTRRSGPTVITASLSGKLYKEYPGVFSGPGAAIPNHGALASVTLKSGLNTSQRRGRFIIAGKEVAANVRKLFYFNGVNPVQVLSGDAATTHDITTKAADWAAGVDPGKQPINGTVHRDILFAFGNLNDPHRLYYSTATDHEVFAGGTAGSLRIGSQIGERLFCAATYRGVLFCWKYPRGIFYLEDSDIDYTKWTYRTHSMALGCAPSPYAVLPIDDDILFVDADGHIHLLSAVDTLGGVRNSDITRQLGLQTFVSQRINRAALDTMTATYVSGTKTAYIGCRSLTADSYANDLLLILDFSAKDRGLPIRFSYATAFKPNSLTTKRRDYIGVSTLLLGENATAYLAHDEEYGARIEYDPGVGIGVAEGYRQILSTPELDLADADPALRTVRKHFDAIELILGGTDLNLDTLGMEIRVDGVLRQTLSFRGATRRIKRTLNCGDGHTIQLSFMTSGTGAVDIQHLAALLYYRPGGQDHSRTD